MALSAWDGEFMNYHKYLNSAYLKENPLCAVADTKDSLNLATGSCTRAITKLALTGNEEWEMVAGQSADYYRISNMPATASKIICSHYTSPDTDINYTSTVTGIKMQQSSSYGVILACRPSNAATLAEFKTFLSTQYAAETPVTIWFIAASSSTESITVPTGLTGTVYGSLTQAETPTPSAPVYPTGNDCEAWYDIGYHKRVSSAWTDVENVYERDNGAWTNS